MNSFSSRLAVVLATALPSLCAATDPDLIVSDIPAIARLGPVGGIHGYALGYSLCNTGDAPAAYIAGTNQHPIIGFALYRIADGRIDQIGISWMKHAFCALQQSGHCGVCQPGDTCIALGVGCYDTSSALGGSPTSSGAGPRFEVNPVTGEFRYPFSSPGGVSGTAIHKLCQVSASDLAVPQAQFLFEAQVVEPRDNSAGLSTNNFSYRRAVLQTGTANFLFSGPTIRGTPAIHAWRDHGLGADQPDPSVLIRTIDGPGDGRFVLASKAVDLGNGLWRYTYAVQNMTSDRAARRFIIPIAAVAPATNPSFRDVAYHSGEPFDLTDWRFISGPSAVQWDNDTTFLQNPDANALRWGSTCSFRFDFPAPPRIGTATLQMFKPGTPVFISAAAHAPAPACAADVDNGTGLGGPDGAVTIEDLLFFLAMFEASDPRADTDDGSGTGAPDGGITIEDLLQFLIRFDAGC